MGLLSGWLEGGTAWAGEKREVDALEKLKEVRTLAVKLFSPTGNSFRSKAGVFAILSDLLKSHPGDWLSKTIANL